MKAVNLAGAVIAAMAPLISEADERKMTDFDMALDFRIISPAQQEDWDSASGVELQACFWKNPEFGVALAFGMDQWEANAEFTDESDEYGRLSMSVSGNAKLIPIGLSLLYRPMRAEHVSLLLHGGLRYVIVESDITTETVIEDYQGSSVYHDPVQTGNSLVGLVGLTIEGTVDEGLWLRAGIGYQFDVVKPHERYLGADIGTTSFAAAVITLGIGWSF